MEDKIDWQKVGIELEKFINIDLYPGIGYETECWKAWVFLQPLGKSFVHNTVKAEGVSLLEAIEELKGMLKGKGFKID